MSEVSISSFAELTVSAYVLATFIFDTYDDDADDEPTFIAICVQSIFRFISANISADDGDPDSARAVTLQTPLFEVK